jgi:hypothetical protein
MFCSLSSVTLTLPALAVYPSKQQQQLSKSKTNEFSPIRTRVCVFFTLWLPHALSSLFWLPD